MVVLERAAHAAFLLESPGEVLHFRSGQAQAGDEGNRLAAATLGFPMQSNNAVPERCGAVLATYAIGHGPVTLWAEASRFGGIDQVALFILAHGSGRAIVSVRQYISLPKETGTDTSEGEPGLAGIDDFAAQLIDVQTQLAYQEDLLRELNGALASQQQEILVLRRQVQLLKQRQDEHGEPQAAGAAQERPPHY